MFFALLIILGLATVDFIPSLFVCDSYIFPYNENLCIVSHWNQFINSLLLHKLIQFM